MKNAQKFAVLIWADKRKTDSQGLVPLYARITYLSKRAEISLGRKGHPKNWDAEPSYVKGNSAEVKDINMQIMGAINEIRRAFGDLKATGTVKAWSGERVTIPGKGSAIKNGKWSDKSG